MNDVSSKAWEAYRASLSMAALSTEEKNKALLSLADSLWVRRSEIMEANRRDLERAGRLLGEGLMTSAAMSRLVLDEAKICKMVEMVRSVIGLSDPVGVTNYSMELDDGLNLYRVTSPVGVIGFVFESRPDALVQIASLCLKSGNSCLLKGGSEAQMSNRILFNVVKDATASIQPGWVQLLEERSEVMDLLVLDEFVDLVIPRGSNTFVKYVQDNTRIPVLGHSEGVCNIYVDSEVDVSMAVNVCIDSKVQYPAVCNAVDCILVHSGVAEALIPRLIKGLQIKGVEVRVDHRVRSIFTSETKPLTDSDLGEEYLDYIVAIRVVDDLEEAVNFINRYGSHHTDAIMTLDPENARRFMSMVDSASVFWNASTRFADGYRYGLGAEVGISTGKIHARGPTGLEGLVSYKYYLKGDGHVVADYAEKRRSFKHIKSDEKW